MKIKPIVGLDLPMADPMHQLCCVSLHDTGHAKIKFVLNDTYTIPANYRSYRFKGNYGLVVISVHINSCHSEELIGKILRYVKQNYFTNHELKFIEEVKND